MSKKHRLIILSLDAVGRKDMEFLLTLPNFSKFVSEGAFCDKVYSVYPSLTYPAHSSIVTGMKPCNHGIVANTKLQPNRDNPDWLYKRKYIKADTLVDLAKRKGYTICSLLWPVMGGAKIDYNMPEVMVTRKYQNQITACLVNGSPKYLLELNSKFGKMRKGISQPELDDFLMASAKYTIEKYDPDMMLIHLTDVDTTRHNTGAVNDCVTEALRRHDRRLGQLTEWLEAARPMEDTTFVVLGDHCQMDTSNIIYPNKYLADMGLIDIKDSKITDYRAIARSCDGSAYIYVNEKYKNNSDILDKIADVLNEMKKNNSLGIEEIFTGEEAARMGADSKCVAMLESKPGFYFLNQFDVLTEKVSETKNHAMHASHGYLPTKEENITFFAAKGKGIKKGSRPESMYLWDEGVTIAKIMGWELSNADGRVAESIVDINAE